MSGASVDEIIAVDWGTTSLRATLVTNGQPGASTRSSAGVRGLSRRQLAQTLDDVVAALPPTDGPIVLSGMVGSTAGLMVAPYVDAPAGVHDIARAIERVPRELLGRDCSGREVVIIPGVRFAGPAGVEFMRGEETQVLGAGTADGVVVAPGSHSKWIAAPAGRISAFTTAMTGEAYSALGSHTLLAESLTAGLSVSTDEREEFLLGVDEAQELGLLFTIFSVRARALAGASPQAGAARLSGLVIGAELHGGLAWSGHPSQVTIIADEALAGWYRLALSHLDVAATTADGLTAARGAWRLAQEGWRR